MANVASFTFNVFQENTYIIYDDTKSCIIIDPGCSDAAEEQILRDFISENELQPVRLINTHCHIDHVWGNKFVANTYNLPLEIHKGELAVLNFVPQVAQMYNLQVPDSPAPQNFLAAGDVVSFGNTELTVLFTPGHSPASISLYNATDSFVIAGDVLFKSSIGRTDLPGASFAVLKESIRTQLYTLPNNTVVYAGHMEHTTIGFEKIYNPFVKG